MKFIYTLTPPPRNVCVLTKDMETIERAVDGKHFSNTVVSNTLLEAEEMFNLQRAVEPEAKISVRCIDVGTVDYWAMNAREFPGKSFQDLRELGY